MIELQANDGIIFTAIVCTGNKYNPSWIKYFNFNVDEQNTHWKDILTPYPYPYPPPCPTKRKN